MSQAQTAPVAAPPAPTAPVANQVPVGALTPRDIAAMRARKNELSGLLSNVSSRRKEVQNLLRTATTPADRSGLEQRLSYLDGRITRIEAEIDQNSSQLASLEALRTEVGNVPPPGRGGRDRSDAMIPVFVCFVLFVLSPIALTFSRYVWKRSNAPVARANPENTERLVRMEQAIDSIAIEMERVSEGQRFVTRLLAEGKSPAQVGASKPAAEPVPVGEIRRSS